MANTIQLRRSATANAVPTTTQLALGELAINTTDGKLYLKKNVSGTESIVEIGSGGASISVSDTAPASPINGSLWWDTTVGQLKIYYTDGTSNQWVDAVNSTAFVPKATATSLGSVEVFSDTVQTVAANAVTTTASRTYGVQLNGADQMVVNVPWSDTNSGGTVTDVTGTAPIVSSGGTAPAISISAATISAAGSMSAADKTKLDGIATSANNYVLPKATATALGGVEVFDATVQTVAANAVTTTASRTYGVQLNAADQMVVNVPWVDTTNTGTVTSVAGTGTVSGLTLTGTVTASGNLTLGGTLSVAASNFASQTANTFLSAPNGAAGTPTFRAIVAADIPTLNQNTTGTAATITGVYSGTITSSQVTTGLGFTPYNATNPSGYTSNVGTVTGVTGTAPIVSSGGTAPAISISAATISAAGSMSAADKTKLDGIAASANNYVLPKATATALGGVEVFDATVQTVAANAVTTTASRTYGVQLNAADQMVVNVPWSDTNSGGTVTSVGGTGTVSGLTLSGTVTGSGNLTLGGTLSLTSGNVTTALGFTPYNSTNPSGYITSSSLSSYLPLTGGTLTGALTVPVNATTSGGGINFSGAGSTFIRGTSGDGASSTTSNLQLQSWFGIGFGPSISGQTVPIGENAAWLDCRSGSFSARADFRAPIFYDSNNTAYYTDPASTSVLNALTVNGGAVYRSDWTTRFQSGSDFVDGTLVTTDIPATASAGESFVIEITGKSYDGSNPPFKVVAQGYLYNDTIINYSGISYAGNFATYIKVFQDGGVLKFWWPRISYWNSFNVNVMSMDGQTNGTITRNRVTAIGNATEPTGTKKQQITLTKTLKTGDAAGSISGFNNPVTAPTANTIVYRDSAGDISAREIVLSSGLSAQTPTVLVSMYPATNQVVRTTPAAVSAAIQSAASGSWAISVTGNAATVAGLTPSASAAVANRVVVADGNGYIFNNYFNSTDNSVGSGVTAVMVKTGDNYYRSGTAASIATFISGQTMNISGSATSATTATGLNSSHYISRTGSSGNATTDFQNTPAGTTRLIGDEANLTNSPGAVWWFYQNMRHSNAGNYWGTQVAWGWEDNANRLRTRNVTGGSFGSWIEYLNTAGHTFSGNLNLTGSIISTNSDVRAPIFYDQNNTGYYVDPTSTTALRTVGSWRADSSTWDGEFNGKIQYHSNNWYFQAAGEWIFRKSDSNSAFWVTQAGVVQCIGDMRAPIFYDYNNTNYYVNPAGSSVLFSVEMINQRCSFSRQWDNYPGISVYNTTDQGPQADFRIFGSVGANGGDFSVRLLVDGDITTLNSLNAGIAAYSPIYYDSNNTGYYLDASGTCNINSLICAGLFTGRSSGSTDVNSANDTGSISIRGSTTTIASMSFHRTGAYAINMGLGTDNIFRIGGWSASSNAFQMDGSGNLTMLNNVTAYSDIRLKKDIVKIDNALHKVQQLNGYTYTRIDTGNRQMGVIAQEVIEVIPEVVLGSEETNYSVAYGNMVGLLIEAIKEQQEQIKRLEERVNSLGE